MEVSDGMDCGLGGCGGDRVDGGGGQELCHFWQCLSCIETNLMSNSLLLFSVIITGSVDYCTRRVGCEIARKGDEISEKASELRDEIDHQQNLRSRKGKIRKRAGNGKHAHVLRLQSHILFLSHFLALHHLTVRISIRDLLHRFLARKDHAGRQMRKFGEE